MEAISGNFDNRKMIPFGHLVMESTCMKRREHISCSNDEDAGLGGKLLVSMATVSTAALLAFVA